MNEKFLLLFENNKKNYEWETFNSIKDSIIYKNSLIENTIKYPISESINNKSLEKIWKKVLNLEEIGIDNINDILKNYDNLAYKIINDPNKRGYRIKEKELFLIYNNENIITQLKQDKIQSCYIRTGQVDLFPLFYTLKYNSYNMFFLDTPGPIEYKDIELQHKIETIISNNKSIKESIIEYAETNREYISYHLIRDYYKGTTNYTVKDLEKYIRNLEDDITSILRNRRKIINRIKEIEEQQKEIDETNKKTIKEIRTLNIFLEENNKLKLIEDEKIKTTKTDKFIKTNTDIFIDFSKNGDEKTIDEYIKEKINQKYYEINNYPKEIIKQKKELIEKLETDIVSSYLIGINYYLIMIAINLSDNTLESIYEGNLINKAIFNINEIKELIELINKNLLILE